MRIAHITTAALSTIAIALSGVVAPVSAAPAGTPTEGTWTNAQHASEREGFGQIVVAPDGYAVADVWNTTPNGCTPQACPPGAFDDVLTRAPGGHWVNGGFPARELLDGATIVFDDDSNGWAVGADPSSGGYRLSYRPHGGSWTTGEVVPDLRSPFAALLLTSTGTPVIWGVWGETGSLSLQVRALTPSGWQSWTRTVDGSPSLTTDDTGGLHAAWVRGSGATSEAVISSLGMDSGWSTDRAIFPTDAESVTWLDDRSLLATSPETTRIASQLDDGSWDAEAVDLGDPTAYPRTDVGAGEIAVVWNRGDVIRSVSRSARGTWSRPATIGRGSGAEVAVDSRGNATVVWFDASGATLYAQHPVNSSWTKPGLIPTVDRRDFDGIAIGAGGDTVIVGGTSATFGSTGLYTIDRTNPVAITTVDRAPSRGWAATSTFSIGWKTMWTEADTHDVRYTLRKITRGPAKRHRLATGTHADHTKLRGKSGRVYCLSARAHAGTTTGPWGEATCVATPLDDRALKAGHGWKRAGGTSVARMRGATLTSPRISGSRFALLVRPSAGAGTVQVSLGSHRLGTYRLAQGKPGQRRVIALGGFKHAHHGKLQIKVVSSGKPVRIDGIYAR